ncbi:MAG: penicillin binding protein PBP4B, partial [Gammaproteobacteria bacterium]|nr:penicillin binding protein PBP4B [Gammaproteobacteria bacterium]
KNVSQRQSLTKGQSISIDIGQYTLDGYNSLKVENIKPAGSSIVVNIPFPTLSIGKPASEGFSSKKLKKIDDLINKEIAEGFPGTTLLIAKNGKIIKNTAYGYSSRYDRNGESLAEPLAMKTDTLFDMASNTKMYATNYAVMKLVSEGSLDIHKPISEYLAEYSGEGRDSRTVKDLLTHSAGYPATVKFHTKENHLGERFFSQNKENTQYLLIQRVPFETGRNLKAVYSDIDYMLLGTLIERVTGMALDEYVENEIYAPLGLTHTLFNPLQKGFEINQTAATELMGNSRGGKYQFDNMRDDVIYGQVHDEKAFYSMAGVSGHAGIFSTTKDTAILASVMLNRGGYGDLRLFDKNIIDQFIKPSDLNITMGLGWRRAGNGERIWQYGPYASPYAYGHTGWTGTVTVIDPFYDLIIVLLTNKKHTEIIETEDGKKFAGDTFETGKYGSIISLVYEAFLEKD